MAYSFGSSLSSVSVLGVRYSSDVNPPTEPLFFPRPFDRRKFFSNLCLKVLTIVSFVTLVRLIRFLAAVRSSLRPNIRGNLSSGRKRALPPVVDRRTDRFEYLIHFSDCLFLFPFRTGNPDPRSTHDRFRPDRGAVLRLVVSEEVEREFGCPAHRAISAIFASVAASIFPFRGYSRCRVGHRRQIKEQVCVVLALPPITISCRPLSPSFFSTISPPS